MARLINSTITSTLKFNVITNLEDGSSTTATYVVGDTVTGLRYIENHELKTVTGKIVDINIKQVRKPTISYSDMSDTFSKEVIPVSLVIDASAQYASKLITVPAMEIVENAGVKNVKSVVTTLSLIGNISSTYTDDTEDSDELIPGTMVDNIIIMNSVRGRDDITGTFKLVKFFYNVKGNDVTITSILFYDGKSMIKAPVENIIRIGDVIEVIADEETITEAINDPDTNTVAISAVTYSEAVEVKRELFVLGANTGTDASKGKRAVDGEIDGETVLDKIVKASENAELTIDGVTLSGEALLTIKDAKKVIIKNTRFVGLTPPTNRAAWFSGLASDEPVLLQVENCFFGTYVDGTGKIYNGFEFAAKLADGSYIKNCRFAKGVCTHNNISLYGLVDDATVEISGNTFDYAGNACRIGFKGDPKGTVIFANNTWLETDPSDDYAWAGLVIVQPYAAATTTFANLTVSLKDNINKSGQAQDVYVFYNPTDTNITEELMPVILKNGKNVTNQIPVYTYEGDNLVKVRP